MLRGFLLASVLLSALTITLAAEPTAHPNIVFIMADDLGYGHLGCYGQQHIKTPHIDRMAEEGTRFTQFYAGHCVCAPSRSVLMTGYHTGHTSVRVNGGGSPLLPKDITVAEVLGSAGYATGGFGKWGLGDDGTTGVPYQQGFDEFFGYLHQVHAHFYYPYFLWDNDQKFLLRENDGQKRNQYSHDLVVDRALDFLGRYHERPFFLYMPITIPHFELLVPEDSLEQYRGKFPEPTEYTSDHYASQPTPRAALAAMITRMDRDVGRVLTRIQELGIDDKTIVFFTSDNGGYRLAEEFFHGNGPLRGGKGELYEGGLRVPLVVRWPGRVAADKTDGLVWAFWDIMPTLAELAGVESPKGIDGVSFAPRLLGQEQPIPDCWLYWETIRQNRADQPPWSVAARKGNWKAVRNKPNLPIELFDLNTDQAEDHDVSNERPEIVAEFREYLKNARTAGREFPQEKPTWGYPPLDTGYVR
jgi:arylsulfatase A-like enzyme